VGEVWIAAGQSNMELPLKMCWGGKEEIARADNPNLRLLDRQRSIARGKAILKESELEYCTPERFYKGEWNISSPESAAEFSGVAWFFGKQIQRELGVPVGIIHVAIGGAPCEAFISEPALLKNPLLLPEVADNGCWLDNPAIPEWVRGRARLQLTNWLEHPKGVMPGHPFQPTFLYRAAIQPLEQFPVRGVIWYQGESNATATDGMKAMPKNWARAGFETLVRDWRRQFGQGDLPFYFVQLPNFGKHNWMAFREMQLEVSKEVPNTGMAVAIDVGDPKNVHPKNKRPVGDRLARLALAKTYGKDIPFSGPAFREFRVEGGRVRALFDFADGLHSSGGGELRGFEIAGKDGAYHPARAEIDGSSTLLSAPQVSAPVAIRYGWAPDPGCNLVNAANLPASPFRAGEG
jgi:sialate O-acetylesterase